MARNIKKVENRLKKIAKLEAQAEAIDLPEGWVPNAEKSARVRRLELNKEYGWSGTTYNIDRYLWFMRHRKRLIFPLLIGAFPYDPVKFVPERVAVARELESEMEIEKKYNKIEDIKLVIGSLHTEIPHLEHLAKIDKFRQERSRGIASLKAARREKWAASVRLDYFNNSDSKARLAAATELYEDRFKSLQDSVIKEFGEELEKQNGLTTYFMNS